MNKHYKRTPDKFFKDIPNFSYKVNYLENLLDDNEGYKGFRIAYIDENQNGRNGIAFFIHGHPTWSYLWRHLIPIAIKKDYRVIAIDLPGFGKSDKPTAKEFFTFNNYRNIILKFMNSLSLKKITLLLHEWGGTLGLTLPMEKNNKINDIVCFSAFLGSTITGLSDSYINWLESNTKTEDLNVRALMARTNRILSLAECNAYEAPFPSVDYKLALRQLPAAFPKAKDINGFDICLKTVEWWQENDLEKCLVLGGGKDPLITVDKIKLLSKLIASEGYAHVINPAGHFVPEWGMEFGEELFEYLNE